MTQTPVEIDLKQDNAKRSAFHASQNKVALAPARSASKSTPPPPEVTPAAIRVIVSLRVFRCCWVAIVLMHCFNAVVLYYIAALYLYLVGSSVIVDFAIYSVTMDASHFPAVANMYFVLAAIHASQVAIFLFRSVRQRKLTFRGQGDSLLAQPTAMVRKMSTQLGMDRVSSQVLQNLGTVLQTTQRYSPQLFSRFAKACWNLLQTYLVSMDVRSKYYGLVFLFRELVLTFLQTYQTYRLSCLVPRLWMNNVMVALLVFNCWATPFLYHAFRSNAGLVRLAGALVNMLLDMVSYFGLPAALLMPYANNIDKNLKNFNRSFWYTDIWLIEMINEAQLIFVTSVFDAISKFLIALSVARGLYTMTKLLCTTDSLSRASISNVSLGRQTKLAAIVPAAISNLDEEQQISASTPRLLSMPRVEKAGRSFLLFWGFFVLIAHLHASSLPSHPQCLLSTRPWFGSRPSCSLVEINCIEENAIGNGSEIDRLLQLFDADRVEYLVIRHCASLQVPTRVQTLNQIFGLKIYNSTILEWGEEAAVTNTHHPALRFLFLVDVRLRELPIGMLSHDFPRKLKDVELSRTNLTKVPDNLDKIWLPGMYIAFEECQLQEFPLTVLRLRPPDLSFGANSITTLPNELLEGFHLRVLLLSGNPIRHFPSKLAQLPQITWFDLIGTSLESLPDWMDETYLASTFILAGQTPLCDRLVAAGDASSDEPRALVGIPGIDCTLGFIGNGSYNWYPIDDEMSRNPSYSLS